MEGTSYDESLGAEEARQIDVSERIDSWQAVKRSL
jgi:hypothetical protein